MRRLITILWGALFFVASHSSAMAEQRFHALVAGPPDQAKEFVSVLEHYGARTTRLDDLDQLPRALSRRYEILIICAAMQEQPLELNREQAVAIHAFLERGGHAFIEYAVLPEGVLSGWRFDRQPLLTRFESLAVAIDNPLGSGLRRDDLLEEHNSRFIKFSAPASSHTLINYGLYLGTYSVARQIKDLPTFFNITVDLGRELSLASAEQWYGGLAANYAPDLVKVSIAGEDRKFREVGSSHDEKLENLKARIKLNGQIARYVRFYVTKQKHDATSDFVVLNGIEIYDTTGRNVALHRPYEFKHKDEPSRYEENGPLTRGDAPRPWSEDRSHLFPAPALRGLNQDRWPALVSCDFGKGRLIYAATSLSTFRKLNYRLTERWEALIRGICLSLVPEQQQVSSAAHWISLRAWTEPRRWVTPDQPVELHVETVPGLRPTIHSGRWPWTTLKGLQWTELTPGHFVANLHPNLGATTYTVRVEHGTGWNRALVSLTVADRADMYRRALDRNMRWFLNAGVMDKLDGSTGIRSTIEIGALYAGKAEDLPGAYRADCQAMSGKAFYLYGDLTGDSAWHQRAENLAQVAMRCQFNDPTSSTCGAYRWLTEGCDSIYPQDDNNRIAEYLGWLYTRTGKTEYLRSAVAAIEFARDTSREDSTLSYWVTDPRFLPFGGRAYLRGVSAFANVTDWCLYRYHHGWRATGDASYAQAMADLLRIYAPLTFSPEALSALPGGGQFQQLGDRGQAIAMHYLASDDPLRKVIIEKYDERARQTLARDDVRRWGEQVQPNDMSAESLGYAFSTDSSIHTWKGEPLTDQLYETSQRALARWEAYQACGSDVARRLAETEMDYLVRIQMDNSDPRLDGCWVRGFDMQHWECYGTRYDPNYGAYHAYTGWMNENISTALAEWLLNENPFIVNIERQRKAMPVLQEVRQWLNPDYLREVNYLHGVTLHANRKPDLGSRTLATITDGQVEGYHNDNLSAGWSMSPQSDPLTIVLEGDLKSVQTCRRLSVRVGGLDVACQANHIIVEGGESASTMHELLNASLDSADGSNWFDFTENRLRYFRITLIKHNPPHRQGEFYLGEVRLIGLQTSTASKP